jgi:hypothetical protein
VKTISECTLEEIRQELFIYHHMSAGDQLANMKKYHILIEEMGRRGIYDPEPLPFDEVQLPFAQLDSAVEQLKADVIKAIEPILWPIIERVARLVRKGSDNPPSDGQ